MRKFLGTLTVLGALSFSTAGIALAADPHSPANPNGPATGQPSQSCQAQPSAPGGGNSSHGTASPFVAGSSTLVYAGAQAQNSKNPKSVSQYDVACFQNSQPGHP
jgi:hypothetical protein